MRPAEILRAAKEKISDPARWCRGVHAMDAAGYPVCTTSPRAVTWCALGAIASVDSAAIDTARDLINSAADQILPGYAAAGVNDLKGHADVMAMFDRAIALAEAEELSGARSVE